MKKGLFICLLASALVFSSCASLGNYDNTPEPTAPTSTREDWNGNKVYEKEFSESKNFYKIALLWVADTYKNPDKVIRMQDEEMQIIKGHGMNTSYIIVVSYYFTIKVKDNTVTITFDNFRQGTDEYPLSSDTNYQKIVETTNALANDLFNYIENF